MALLDRDLDNCFFVSITIFWKLIFVFKIVVKLCLKVYLSKIARS
jgi:hypothetical protein